MITRCCNTRLARGLTLIEVAIFIGIISVAMLATMLSYVHYAQMKNSTQQEREAAIAAEQKLAEIRSYISGIPVGSNPLDAAYTVYRPSSNSNAPCYFSVANLPAIGNDPVGTVTIINSEKPDETQFGVRPSGGKPFCVDLYGNKYRDGGFPASVAPQSPFPLDIDGDGATTNLKVTSNFCLLPVVITVRWVAPDGNPKRIDVFSILSAEQEGN